MLFLLYFVSKGLEKSSNFVDYRKHETRQGTFEGVIYSSCSDCTPKWPSEEIPLIFLDEGNMFSSWNITVCREDLGRLLQVWINLAGHANTVVLNMSKKPDLAYKQASVKTPSGYPSTLV